MANTFIRDLFSVFNSRVAVICFGLGASIITARYLGPQGNGIIAGLMVYPSLFMAIGSLGIRQSTTYFVGQNKYPVKEIYGAVLAIWLITSIFCVLTSFLLIRYFTKDGYSLPLVFLAIIGIPFSLYTTYSSGVFLGQQNIKDFNRINWIPAGVNLLVTFILVVVFPFGVEGSMIGTFAGVFILSFFVVRKMGNMTSLKPVFNYRIIKEMLSLGIIYAVSLLMISMNYNADIILLEKLSTKHELGIYSKGVSIAIYLWEVPTLLSTIVFSRSAAAKDPAMFSVKVCRLLRIAGVLVLLVCGALFLVSGVLIKLMFGSEFEGSAVVLKLLLPGVYLLTIFKVLNVDLAGKGKPWLSMIAMFPAVIVNIILNYLWVPKYGANGSAFASTVSYTFASIVFLFVYSKTVRIPIKKILFFHKEDFVFIADLYNHFKAKLVKA